MPRDTSDIGTSGLEQGGANLGNDISRPITSERNEQNTTTNAGSHPNLSSDKKSDTEDGDEGGSMPDPEETSLRSDE